MFADDGFRYLVGRAYPGVSCLRPRIVSVDVIMFGIQHQHEPEVWMIGPLANDLGIGWAMEINQPSQAQYDMERVFESERCR